MLLLSHLLGRARAPNLNGVMGDMEISRNHDFCTPDPFLPQRRQARQDILTLASRQDHVGGPTARDVYNTVAVR